MKFNLLLEEILEEALSADEIYEKYYKDIPRMTFNRIVTSDPMTKSDGKNIQKIGKYSKILLNMFKNGNLKLEDLPRATEYLEIVYKYNISLDIKKIQSLPDMYNHIEKYLAQEESDFYNIVKQLGEDEYQLVFNGKEWVVYVPKTEKAACYLGVNTEWCTTWGKLSLNKSYRDRDNHFSRHNNQGPLFVIVKKDDTNEKYQFHFESKQYMDKADRRIKTEEFLDKNEEIRNFFFPSLTKDVSKEQLNIDVKRMDVLSSDYSTIIMRKSVGPEGQDNKLVQLLLSKKNYLDKKEIEELIQDSNLIKTFNGYPIEFDSNHINFELEELSSDLESVENVLSYWNYDADQAYDRMYEDVRNNDTDSLKESFETILTDYYKKNQNILKSTLGIINLEQFIEHYLESTFEALDTKYYESYANINAPNYESEVQEAINDVQRYITISQNYSSHSVGLNLIYFVKFLIRENIDKIDGNLDEILDGYVSTYNIPTDYDYIYPNTIDYPTYDEHNDITSAVDDYFDNILEDDEEKNKGCLELRKKLNDVINSIFKGKNILDNEHIHIELPNYIIDCEDGSIMIKYHNKDTNKKYEGKIKVDNLASYATNYQLFETYVTYKKNIL